VKLPSGSLLQQIGAPPPLGWSWWTWRENGWGAKDVLNAFV
ncbi:13852_t:CDS:2, partial [Funneliformis mosseae]